MPGSFEINHLKIKIYAFLNSYSSYSDYFIYQTWGFPFAASNTVRAALLPHSCVSKYIVGLV